MNAVLINDFNPETGAGNYAFSLYQELKWLDPEIEMLYLESNQPLNDVENLLDVAKIRGLRLPIFNRTLNNLYIFPKKIPPRFNLYHATNQFLGRIALKRKPCIVTCLDVIPVVLKNDYPWLLRFFLDKAIEAMRSADRIITISEFTKQEIVEKMNFDAGKIETIYLGFDEKIFKPRNQENARRKLGLPLDRKIILHIGSEEPRKNLPMLLEALAEIKKELPDLMFVRVGEKRKETEKLARQLGLEETIKYFASVPLTKLGLFYNAADVFVFPSYYEGFGLPVLEAMASGCPVITSNTTSLPEVGGQATLSIDPSNTNAWQAAVAKILTSTQQRELLRKKGLRQSEKFSWQICAAQTFKIYGEVSR